MALTRENLSQSRFFLLFMSALVALGPLSIDTYMPAIPAMSRYFGVPISAVNLTMSAYLIGSGIGQFLGGALSDHLGRKVVALAGLGVFVVCSALIGLLGPYRRNSQAPASDSNCRVKSGFPSHDASLSRKTSRRVVRLRNIGGAFQRQVSQPELLVSAAR